MNSRENDWSGSWEFEPFGNFWVAPQIARADSDEIMSTLWGLRWDGTANVTTTTTYQDAGNGAYPHVRPVRVPFFWFEFSREQSLK
jgi:hypothetical protein